MFLSYICPLSCPKWITNNYKVVRHDQIIANICGSVYHMPGIVQYVLYILILFNSHNTSIHVIIPNLKMRKLKFRLNNLLEVTQLVIVIFDLTPSNLTTKPQLLTTILCKQAMSTKSSLQRRKCPFLKMEKMSQSFIVCGYD